MWLMVSVKTSHRYGGLLKKIFYKTINLSDKEQNDR